MTNKSNPKKKETLNTTGMMLGQTPPNAQDIEVAILGGLMLEQGAIDVVLSFLTPEVFYLEKHQQIFRAMINLNCKSQPIDILTVSEELLKQGILEQVGGNYYIHTLTNYVTSSANIERHSRIIFQKYIQRKLIAVGKLLIDEGFSNTGDCFEMLDEAEQHLFNVSGFLHSAKYLTIDNILVSAVREIDQVKNSKQQLSGVTSGYKSIDKITHGWQATDLIVLAARPGIGKTCFALNLARNAAMSGVPVAFFSLEMSAGQLVRRMMSSESEIALYKIQRGQLEDDGMIDLYQKAVKPLSGIPLFIDDSPGSNIFELRAKCRKMVSKEKVGIIFIDYLQLMSGTPGRSDRNREQEISEISRGLKKLAKELNVPIIALSQLSRETEKRTNKEPMLSDLRESGAIEQDSDAVIFIYRPEYYGIQKDANGENLPGETHLKFAKYRNGAPGLAKLQAKLWIQKFQEIDEVVFPKKEEKNITNGFKKNDQADFGDTSFKN